jgi:hypothetical protein
MPLPRCADGLEIGAGRCASVTCRDIATADVQIGVDETGAGLGAWWLGARTASSAIAGSVIISVSSILQGVGTA